jgi:hypothetical protein
MSRRQTFLLAVALGLLAGAAALLYTEMQRARRLCHAAAEDLRTSTKLASRIETIRERPTMADEHERLSSETTGLIESAARKAEISGRSLVRITPQPPRRVEETVYKEKPTHVMLKDVSLQQVGQMVAALLNSDAGLAAKSIRLGAPRSDDTSALWSAELVVTYLIYDPPVTR